MQFVEMSDLKVGMRLARPVYNKSGVLLFDRDSKLTTQAIESVKKFGLLGMYILDPAEPLPPMSEEDLEFERFQTMTVFSIMEEIEKILQTRHQSRLQNIIAMIIKKYGHKDEKINFYQNLRSKDDYICRHSLNVAILCTMLTHTLNVRVEEQRQIVEAALLHDIGKMNPAQSILYSSNEAEKDEGLFKSQLAALDVLDNFSDGVSVKRICAQALRTQHELLTKGKLESNRKLLLGAKILLVANRYDELTAMDLKGKSESEVKAIQEFYEHPEVYDPQGVEALIQSVNILFAGVSVELNTGEKALVMVENKKDILKPTVLCFKDNMILDLALAENQDIQIVDIVKTMDNRYIMADVKGKQALPGQEG